MRAAEVGHLNWAMLLLEKDETTEAASVVLPPPKPKPKPESLPTPLSVSE